MRPRKRMGAFHEPKGRAASPLRAGGCNHAFLERKERRARSDAPYLAQLVHGPDARPLLDVEAFQNDWTASLLRLAAYSKS
jgi:hypothetical protein